MVIIDTVACLAPCPSFVRLHPLAPDAAQRHAGSAAWEALEAEGTRRFPFGIRGLFERNRTRFETFHRRAGDVLVDFSKTAVDASALKALLTLAHAQGFDEHREAMVTGGAVNVTERRAALHMALRGRPVQVPRGVGPDVARVLEAMRQFTADVHHGRLRSHVGERYTDVLHIGIGGSSLGPALAIDALARPEAPLRAHFLENLDPHAWERLSRVLDPARTLVLVASKTFKTTETMANARMVRTWLTAAQGQAAARIQFVALCADPAAALAFGIPADQIFELWDWVGGRFSLWSSIGLSIMLACGFETFSTLLAGARAMDDHFLTAEPADNVPLLLALLSVWHGSIQGLAAEAVLPYDERLALLPAWLQQLEMESLGKQVGLNGEPVDRPSGIVVFGSAGTNAQHSFMQFLHQGARPIPAHFILVARPDHGHEQAHRMLLANGLAQAEALLRGKSADEVRAEMRAAGYEEAEIEALVPHRTFSGDRPSITTIIPRLDAWTLGQLLALFEHKVFCEGVLWGVNPFDQWGVELGKKLAADLLPALNAPGSAAGLHDDSTCGLIGEIHRLWAERAREG